ncbi:hypothetical protein CRM90_28870 [Mycobacterium sp. ENV421]|nr:hypothetical protein CRM90_28870 [Mycobacterium sp. ENV421]
MVAGRRLKVDDPHRWRLPDSPDSEPSEVLDYLRKFSGVGIPRWVLQADVCDALTLNNWLWWEDRRRELHFLRVGRDRGLFLSQMGAQVGVGKQGVLDRIDRLEALLRYDRPDEKITRAARRLDHLARERVPSELAWVQAHRDEILSVITGLVGQADRFSLAEQNREWLEELVVDARDDELRPTTMVLLGLASAELRTAPSVLELDSSRPFMVHTILARADRLRCDFAAIGASECSGLAAGTGPAD